MSPSGSSAAAVTVSDDDDDTEASRGTGPDNDFARTVLIYYNDDCNAGSIQRQRRRHRHGVSDRDLLGALTSAAPD